MPASVDRDIKLSVGINTNSVKQDADKLAKSIQGVFSHYSRDSKSANANLMSLQHQMAKYSNELNKAYDEQRKLANQKLPTAEYTNTENAITKITERLNTLNAKETQMIEVGKALGKSQQDIQKSSSYQNITYQIRQATTELERYKRKLDALKTQGADRAISGVDTAQYSEASNRVVQLQNRLAELQARYNQVGKSSTKSGINLSTSFKNAFKGITGVYNKLKQLKGNTSNTFNDMAKSAKKSFMTILKYAFSIRSIFILFKRLKTYTKEAFNAMSQSIPRVRDDLNSLSSSFGQVKNSLATAFQPILSYAVPALNALAGALVTAMNALANFFATFTGQKVIYKATKANNNLAKSYGGAGGSAKDAAEDIAEYDKLIVINQDKASGGGGGGGSADTGAGLFEEVPAEASKLAQMIKDAWKDADFTDVGNYIGQKLVDAMEGINWDKYKKTGKKIGKSVATFLNGVFETPNLFSDVGKTIAESLNTVIGTLGSFSANFHWDSLGKGMADGVNNFFKTFDFPQLAQTIHDTIVGVLTTAGTFFRETDFKEIGSKLGQFINDLDIPDILSTLGQTIHDAIIGAIDLAVGFFSSVDFKELGRGIGEFINKIDVADLLLNLSELALNVLVALKDAIIGLGEENPLAAAIITMLVGIKVAGKLDKLATAITSGLGSAITSSTGGSVIGSAITGKIKSFFTQEISAATFTSSATNLVGVIGSAIATAVVGYKLGNMIYELWQPEIDKAMEWMMGDVREWTPEELANTTANDIRAQMISKYEKYDFGYTELNEYADLVAGKYQEALDKGATTQQAYAYAVIETADAFDKLTGEVGSAQKEYSGYQSTYDKFVNQTVKGDEQINKSSNKTTETINKNMVSQSVSYKKGESSVESLSSSSKKSLSNMDKYAKKYIQFKQGETNISSLDNKAKQAFTAINGYLADTGMSVEEFARIYGIDLENASNDTSEAEKSMGASFSAANGHINSSANVFDVSSRSIANSVTTNFSTAQREGSSSSTTLKNNVISNLTTINTDGTSKIQSLKNAVVSSLTNMNSDSTTPLSNFATNVSTWMATSLSNVTGKNDSWKTAGQNLISNLQSGSYTQFSGNGGTWFALKEWMTTSLGKITGENSNWKTAGQGLGSSLQSGAGTQFNGYGGFIFAIKTWLQGLGGSNGTIASESGSWGTAGNQLVSGLKTGIANKWDGADGLVEKIKSYAKSLTGTLKKAFGISSPSKEWAEIGNFLDLGLMQGLESKEQKVINSIANMGIRMSGTLQDSLSDDIQLPDIVQGKVIPTAMSYNIQTTNTQENIRDIIREELSNLNLSMPERIAVEMPDSRVLAEVVWDEEAKRYKQYGYA